MGPAVTPHQAGPEAIEAFACSCMSANAEASHGVAVTAAAMAHACEELGLPLPPAYENL